MHAAARRSLTPSRLTFTNERRVLACPGLKGSVEAVLPLLDQCGLHPAPHTGPEPGYDYSLTIPLLLRGAWGVSRAELSLPLSLRPAAQPQTTACPLRPTDGRGTLHCDVELWPRAALSLENERIELAFDASVSAVLSDS